MAGCSKKQYAIMMSAGQEGKKLASEMGSMDQDKFNEAFSALLNSGAYKPQDNEDKYSKETDEDYGDFDADSEDDYLEDNDSEEEDDGSEYLDKTWNDYFSKQKGWERQENGRYDFGDDVNYGSVNDDGEEQGKLTAIRVRNGQHDKPEKQFFDDPQESREWVEENTETNKKLSKPGATADNLNPNNPKYKGFERSHITNAKEVDEGYTYTDANGKQVKESIIKYIPYGALKDGDNRKLYGIVRNYDGSDAPKTGAIVAHSLEDAKDQLEKQVKLGIQGSDRYLGRGKYDEEFFNIIRDNREEGDDEKYRERYGWDFNKPFKEHDFMKDDPYEKWKSEREYRQRLNKILERHPEYLKKYGSRENILKIMKELDGK